MPDEATLKKMLEKYLLRPGVRRRAVDWAMRRKNYNHWRACALVGIDPRVYRQWAAKPAHTELRYGLKELSSERLRLRLGHWRLHILLKRGG